MIILQHKDTPVRFGPYLPKKYFLASGVGESNILTDSASGESITYEASSYDVATCKAGIPNLNVVEYTSLLPAEAQEEKIPSPLPWGAIVGGIRAQENGRKGMRLTAALMVSEVSLRLNSQDWKILGSLVTEYGGQAILKEAYLKMFREVLEMMERRQFGDFSTWKEENTLVEEKRFYYSKDDRFRFRIKHKIGESFLCEKDHGTAMAILVIYEWSQLVFTHT